MIVKYLCITEMYCTMFPAQTDVPSNSHFFKRDMNKYLVQMLGVCKKKIFEVHFSDAAL